MSYWSTATIALSAVIVFLSLAPSIRRHRAAVICYTVIAAGSAGMAVFPMFFGISMANAFGPSSVSPLAYITPLVTFVLVLVPALVLYPWVSPARSRLTALILFGAVIVFSIGHAVFTAIRWHGYADSGYGFRAMFYLLLWLCVHGMRLSLADAKPK